MAGYAQNERLFAPHFILYDRSPDPDGRRPGARAGGETGERELTGVDFSVGSSWHPRTPFTQLPGGNDCHRTDAGDHRNTSSNASGRALLVASVASESPCAASRHSTGCEKAGADGTAQHAHEVGSRSPCAESAPGRRRACRPRSSDGRMKPGQRVQQSPRSPAAAGWLWH